MIPADLREYWARVETALGGDVSDRFYEAFHFDDNEKDANTLAELVLSGTKKATASLLWTYEVTEKPLPSPGSLSVVTNWEGKPLCVIETDDVQITAYNQVSDAFAATEGEGDGSLDYWRKVHWLCFERECARIDKEPTLEMPVVCETFEVVYSEAKSRAD